MGGVAQGTAHDATWILQRIRDHIDEGLPLVPHFGIELLGAGADHAELRLNQGGHVLRPGGSVAGPVMFAMADVAAYALILAARGDPAAVTVDMTINFFRPALRLPLLARAVTLRSGRRLFTADIRITEAHAPDRLIAQATTTYAMSVE